jgi:hypothetical protein
MKNFIAETHRHLLQFGYTATDQDIKRAYWRDRKAASRAAWCCKLPPLSPYHAMKYLTINKIAKHI